MAKSTTTAAPLFSDKELKIIKLICAEATSEEIGEKLKLSYRTIEGKRLVIMRKAKVKSVLGLFKYALKKGIVTLK